MAVFGGVVRVGPTRHSAFTISNGEENAHAGIKGLFIPGPTNVPQAVRLAMDIAMEDQRAPDLPNFHLASLRGREEDLQDAGRTGFLWPASGTGGWEAAMTNTLNPATSC